MPLTEEQVRVEEVAVKEDLTVGKRRVQETQPVQGALRDEEARVEATSSRR